jgi:hypothetical protein
MPETTTKRNILRPILVAAVIIAAPVLLVIWLMIPSGHPVDARARVDSLRRKFPKLQGPITEMGSKDTLRNTLPVEQIRLQQRCDELFNDLMDDYEVWARNQHDPESDQIIASNALRIGEIAQLHDRGILIESPRLDELTDRHLIYLYHVLQQLVMNTRRGVTAADQYIVIDPVELQQMSVDLDMSGASQADPDASMTAVGTLDTEHSGDDALQLDPTMERMVISSGDKIISNELEQLVPAAKFLKMIRRPIWWNPVTEKLRKMLAPGPDVDPDTVRKWERDFDEFKFPLELLISDPPFEWKQIIPRYLDQRLDDLLAEFSRTRDWPGIREHVGRLGQDGFGSQLIAGLPVKLNRKRRFEASIRWAEGLLDHIQDFNNFSDLESFDLPHNREEMLHLAEYVRPWIQDRLLVAACMLKEGTGPDGDNPESGRYLDDPYTGEQLMIETRTHDAQKLHVMLISPGPDLVSSSDRRTWEDDIQVGVLLDRDHPVLREAVH